MRRAMLWGCLLVACRDHGGDGEDGAGDSGGDDDAPGTSEGSSGAGSSGAPSDSGESGTTDGVGESAVEEAARTMPTYLDLHDIVISRTCTPNEGVCHNDKEYPDLHTPQAMLAAVELPCNLVVKDDLDTFDGCERVGDSLTFLYGTNDGFTSEIAYVDLDTEANAYVIALRDEIPAGMFDASVGDSATLSRTYDDGDEPLITLYEAAFYDGGERRVTVPIAAIAYYDTLGLEVLDDVRGGDPNRNGTFGAEAPGFTMLSPGDPATSYLLGRVQGIVPGTPMPLANQPLSSAEMIALTCWIEGLAAPGALDVYATIDYDGCDAAKTFGQPDPDSGHSFANDVQPIFTTYCAASGCHAGDLPQSNLDLSDGRAYESLEHAALQDPSTPLVEPGNPTNSYLMIKLRSKGITGLQMPRTSTGEGEPLPDERLDTIERWIVAGAPND